MTGKGREPKMLPRDIREFEEGLRRFGAPKEVLVHITNDSRMSIWVTGIGLIDKKKQRKFYLLPPDLERKGSFTMRP